MKRHFGGCWWLVGAGFVVGAIAWSSFPSLARAQSKGNALADYVYQLAQEDRQNGRIGDAIQHLHKVLLIHPEHEQAKKELAELEAMVGPQRQQAMDQAIEQSSQPSQKNAPPKNDSETPTLQQLTGSARAVLARSIDCDTYEFDASWFYHAEDRGLTYRWDFGDGATAEGIRAEHAYVKDGSYHVVLNVTSGTKAAERYLARAEEILWVTKRPTAVIQVPETAQLGEIVRFIGKESSDPSGVQLDYVWDFGDGIKVHGVEVPHMYRTTGTYRVRLVVDNRMGSPCSVDMAMAPLVIEQPSAKQMSADQPAAASSHPSNAAVKSDSNAAVPETSL